MLFLPLLNDFLLFHLLPLFFYPWLMLFFLHQSISVRENLLWDNKWWLLSFPNVILLWSQALFSLCPPAKQLLMGCTVFRQCLQSGAQLCECHNHFVTFLCIAHMCHTCQSYGSSTFAWCTGPQKSAKAYETVNSRPSGHQNGWNDCSVQ